LQTLEKVCRAEAKVAEIRQRGDDFKRDLEQRIAQGNDKEREA
jgi:hypothetical protein